MIFIFSKNKRLLTITKIKLTIELSFVILKSFSETIYKRIIQTEYLNKNKTIVADRKEAYNCYGSYKKASGTGKDAFGAFWI